MELMHQFRVFISYSHEDQRLAAQVNDALRGMNLKPVWDRDIGPGTPFSDAIRGLIANAHLFMPLISENSQNRPWVHQETGYAMAINIPVLPVAFGNLPGEMISQLQAIRVELKSGEFDKTDLIGKLKSINLEQLVIAPPARSVAILEVADYPEQRTEMMSRCANRVMELGSHVHLRQRGALSSFSIPNRVLNDPAWKLRGDSSKFYRQLLRNERIALEQHARQSGCSLIVDPDAAITEASHDNPTRMSARLSALLEFLDSMPDEKVKVAMTSRAQEGNLTILGDWFVAESQAPRPGEGYRQTVFNWHAPTVLKELRRFDQEFEEYSRQTGVEPTASRKAAINKIRDVLAGLPQSNGS